MSRYYRDSDSDDDRHRRTTVTRYKVTPDKHSERYERTERVEIDDDRRPRYPGRNSGDLLHGRGPLSPIDRPRSAFEPHNIDLSRSMYYEKDGRDFRRDADRSGITVYESKETDRGWDKRSHYGPPAEEMRVEKRVEERFDDSHGHDVERYRKETEYYAPQSPPPAPVIIRQQSAEPQRIIVQDAPPAPIILPRQQPGVVVLRDKETDREMVRRERDAYEDDYYYRYDRREIGPYRSDRERNHAISRYERRFRRDDDYSYSDDDEFYYRRTVRRGRSESPHHKRHLAEGALAGAGISALLSSRRDAYGDIPENRGQKVLAGAALGALGTEVARRAHSAYEERYGDGEESPDHHHLLKKGLAFGAVALAAAGAAKYFQTSKIEREETHRGRSRTRGYYSGDEYSRSVSRSSRATRSKSRHRSISTAAKTALGTAATAGIIKHLRDKSKSKSRGSSRSRSKSRLRRVAEIGGVAAAAGVANKLWKDHKDKKEGTRDLSESGDDDYYHRRDSRSRGRRRSPGGSRHRSRSRSMARSPYSQPGADPELGLVEYGTDPLYRMPRSGVAPADAVDPDAEARRRERHRRRRRDRSVSRSGSNDLHERSRSKSRLRDMAAAGAAAIGIKEFKDRHDRKDQERRDRMSRERDDDERHYGGNHGRDYFDDAGPRPHSPPHASGGAYYPPYPPTPGGPPMASGANHAPYHHDSYGGAPVNNADYQPYVLQDYIGYAPPPPPPPPAGPPPPPPPETGFRSTEYPEYPAGPPPPPAGPPPTGGNRPPDHVSESVRRQRSSSVRDEGNDGVNQPYQTMEGHRREHIEASGGEISRHLDDLDLREDNGDDEYIIEPRPDRHGRSSSDSAASRPLVHHSRPSRHDSVSSSEDDVENLPDRFDSQGRPLDGRSGRQSRWTSRQGTFHRERQRPGGWDVHGAWQISGTDGEVVDQLAKNFTGALDGQKSWMRVLGDVLGSGLLSGMETQSGRQSHDRYRVDDGNYDRRQRRTRR